MINSLSGAQVRHLRSLAQTLEPVLHVGKAGLSPEFMTSAEAALLQHELVKVRFNAFKEEKDALAAELAEKTESKLVQRVGHTAVFFRQHADPQQRRVTF